MNPKGQGYILCSATSIGTGTTKTTLNAGTNLTLPTIINAVNEIWPFFTCQTLTAGESVNADLIVESPSVFCNPTTMQAPVIGGGLGSFTSNMHPVLDPFLTNIPVAGSSGPFLTISGQALQTNTSAPKMGAILNITDKGTAGRQVFWNTRKAVTLGATTAGTVTETTWQLSNCERIIKMIAAAAPLVVTANQTFSGVANFNSPDFQTTIPTQVTIEPLVASIANSSILNARQPQWGCDIPTNPVVNLSPTFTNDLTLSAACNYMSCVGFYQLGR